MNNSVAIISDIHGNAHALLRGLAPEDSGEPWLAPRRDEHGECDAGEGADSLAELELLIRCVPACHQTA